MEYAGQNQQYAASAMGAQNAKIAGAPNTRDNVQSAALDLGRQIERVAKLAEHLRMVADKIEGGRPEPVNAADADGAAIAHSLVADLRFKHNAFAKMIGACEDQAMRITAALGVQL